MYVAIMTWNSGGIVLFNVNLFLDNYQFVPSNMKQSGNKQKFLWEWNSKNLYGKWNCKNGLSNSLGNSVLNAISYLMLWPKLWHLTGSIHVAKVLIMLLIPMCAQVFMILRHLIPELFQTSDTHLATSMLSDWIIVLYD